MKQLSNASFFEFKKEHDLFVGEFQGTEKNLVRAEDQKAKEGNGKKGDLMGYLFNDVNGMPHYIGASASIVKDFEKAEPKEGDILSFEYLGKGKTLAKKEFNKFRVIMFEDFEEAIKHHKLDVETEEIQDTPDKQK